MSVNINSVNDENFAVEVLQSDKPVLVDFWAPWCGPCRMITPLIEQAATEHATKLKIVKLNIDDAPDAPVTYGVRGVPTLIIFKGGEPVGTNVGALNKMQLDEFILAHVD